MTTRIVSSGVTSSGLTIRSDVELVVVSGGTALDITVVSGGMETVSAGGLASSTTVFGGIQYVEGEAVLTTLRNTRISNGVQNILSGGVASMTVVSSGGVQNISRSGKADAVTISRWGEQYVSGGVASGVNILGGYELVGSGALAENIVLSGPDYEGPIGAQVILSGGVADGVVVSSGGRQVVSSGGRASDTMVVGGGEVDLANGAKISNLSASDGAIIDIEAANSEAPVAKPIQIQTTSETAVIGEIPLGLTISQGILLTYMNQIVSGGVTDDILVSDGASQVLQGGPYSRGVASGSVLRGGQQYVQSGGVAIGTVISASGFEYVYMSGLARRISISSGGKAEIASGGMAERFIVEDGGYERVDSGSDVDGVVVESGGTLELAVGASASYITVEAGGREAIDTEVDYNQTSSGLVVDAGATQQVDEGATVVGTTISSGSQTLFGNALDTELVEVGSGVSEQVVYQGGYASGVTVGSGGEDMFLNGGKGADVVVLSGGRLSIQAGATVSGITVSRGGLLVEWDGSKVTGLTLKPGAKVVEDRVISAKHSLSGFSITSAVTVEDDGGFVSGAVRSGGILEVYGSATANHVAAGGYEYVGGGFDVGTVLEGVSNYTAPTVGSPETFGYQYVDLDAEGDRVKVESGGWQEVHGTAYYTLVKSGGVVEVDSRATLIQATLASGGKMVLSEFSNVQSATLRAGSVLDLTDINATSLSADVIDKSIVVEDDDFIILTIGLSENPNLFSFSLTSDENGGTDINILPGTSSSAAMVQQNQLIGIAAGFGGTPGAPVACVLHSGHTETEVAFGLEHLNGVRMARY